MKKIRIILAGLAALAVPGFCFAIDGVNVDIQGGTDGGPGFNMNVGVYSNVAAAPLTGLVWNAYQFNNTYATALLDDQGSPTDINLFLQGNPGEWSYGRLSDKPADE